MFLLDTNVCIRLLNKSNEGIIRRFQKYLPNEITLCSIVKAELLHGARHSQIQQSDISHSQHERV